MLGQLFLYIGILVTTNLWVMILLWFTIGLITAIRISIGYVFLMELLPKKAQTAVTTGYGIQESLIYVLATVYFWKISLHWFWFVAVGLLWQCVSVVLLYWIPESPPYLVNMGRLEEAKKAFATIAHLNGK